jgi:hypothetical protein
MRELDSFEKNVLLLLIAGMISPSLRKSMNKNDGVFKNSLDVGSLLNLFCDSLEEQIRCRTYFYKNSKLVKENLIHILGMTQYIAAFN